LPFLVTLIITRKGNFYMNKLRSKKYYESTEFPEDMDTIKESETSEASDSYIYEIVETQGCTAFGITVNGKDLYDLPDEDQDKLANYVFGKLQDAYRNKELSLTDLLHNLQPENYYYDSTPCDQCGDSISETTWKI
jgi:hypothetical protein